MRRSAGMDRSASLEAQAKSSVATGSMSMRETDTPVKVEVIEERNQACAGIYCKIQGSVARAPINIDPIVQAVAAFERALEPTIAPLTAGSRAMSKRSRIPRSVGSRCSWARLLALPATADGDLPMTNSTTSAPRPPTRDAVREVKEEALNFAFKDADASIRGIARIRTCITRRSGLSTTRCGIMRKAGIKPAKPLATDVSYSTERSTNVSIWSHS